jgi:hypothetical protein
MDKVGGYIRMRIDNIEQVLATLHKGQWFWWSDSKNRVYENLILVPEVNGVEVNYEKPTQEFLESELARLQAEHDAQEYARNRQAEYPEIGDQLDMLWHAIDTGDWTAAKVKTTEFYTALKAVKDANPK